MEYRKVSTALWSSPDFQALGPPAPGLSSLWVYLLTSPAMRMVPGLIFAGPGRIAEEIDPLMETWTPKAVAGLLDELELRGMLRWDRGSRVIWLLNALGRPEHSANDNQVKGWRTVFDDVPRSCPFRAELWAAMVTAAGERAGSLGASPTMEVPEPFQNPFGTLPEGSPTTPTTVSDAISKGSQGAPEVTDQQRMGPQNSAADDTAKGGSLEPAAGSGADVCQGETQVIVRPCDIRQNPSETLPKPFRNPSGTVSNSVSVSVALTVDVEEEEEGAERASGEPASRPPRLPPASLPLLDTPPPPDDPVVAVIPCVARGQKGGKAAPEFAVTASMVAEWAADYPGIDVPTEVLKAKRWAIENPSRRKTYGGMRSWLCKWLGRAQDDAGSRRFRGAPPVAAAPPRRTSGRSISDDFDYAQAPAPAAGPRYDEAGAQVLNLHLDQAGAWGGGR